MQNVLVLRDWARRGTTAMMVAWALFAGRPAPAAETLAESPAARDARLAWWREARFGLFIHWGPVSLKGTEIGWSRGEQVPTEEYDRLYQQFNPERFDAEAWAKTAQAAGVKYVVLTTKHHDGFCLWPSKLTDYTISQTPFKRDVTGELAAACRRHGLKFCTYHSICDWHHPDYPLGSPGGKTQKSSPDMERYVGYLKGQLAELIKNYGPLGVLWFDGEWESPWTRERGEELYRYLRRLQPSLIINNRIGKGRAGAMSGMDHGDGGVGDYGTPEQELGAFNRDTPWESCMTICNQWAWKPGDDLKPLKVCLRNLITCAGGDGNLLLNVGPTSTGEIEPRQVERLREMGDWLRRNGKSIYGTRGGPFLPGPWGVSTHRGKNVYLHLFDAKPGVVTLPGIAAGVKRASLLAGGKLVVAQTSVGIQLTLPETAVDEIDTIVRLQLDSPAGKLKPVAFEAAAGR